MLTRLIVIILQNTQTSNHYVVYLKLISYHMLPLNKLIHVKCITDGDTWSMLSSSLGREDRKSFKSQYSELQDWKV